MALYLPAGLPAFSSLRSEGYDVRTSTGTPVGSALQLGAVNIMPNKPIAEGHLFRLLARSGRDIEVTLIVPNGYVSSTCPEYTNLHYQELAGATRNRHLDAIIVNGAPVEHLPLREIKYYDGLCEAIDYANTRAPASAFICFGAYAVLEHLYGIPRIINETHYVGEKQERKKFSGLYAHDIRDVRSDFGREVTLRLDSIRNLNIPVSRCCTIDEDALRQIAPKLEIILSSRITGPGIIYDPEAHRLLATPHLEYDGESLFSEYLRDVGINGATRKPLGYEKYVPQKLNPPWWPIADAIFTTWVQAIPHRDSAPRQARRPITAHALNSERQRRLAAE